MEVSCRTESFKMSRVKNLTFALPLKSRHNDDLLQAVAQIYVKTKTMALPVQRAHTDRAEEFVGKGFQKWIKDHDLFYTMSSGSEPQGNARIEREVRELKLQRMRTVLTASRAPTLLASRTPTCWRTTATATTTGFGRYNTKTFAVWDESKGQTEDV